ncbi:Kunitz/Bovine pancreatic trypsin inhibitor domain protein [Dirofilaria immitis]|nr:Kunitz/Bovine pancreatic trypsin inhibitor domain protein [Dirofilaria immitis]
MVFDNIRYNAIFIIFIYVLTIIQTTNTNIATITLAYNDFGIGISLYCEDGIPLLLANDTVKKCLPDANFGSGMSCPEKFWCHIGATDDSSYCCPKNRKVKERCYLAPANGYGSVEIERFWYDWKSATCKQLTYAGYGGNENNFLTRIDCEKACSDVDLNPCELSPDMGTNAIGILSSYRWYFDIAADRCIRFNYLGSAGNTNNFETDRLCLDACGTGNISDVNVCLLPNLPGNGPYKIPRFYYDARNKACKQFVYTGFGGNNNRFIKYEQCAKTCLNSATDTSNSISTVSFVTAPTIVSTSFVTAQTMGKEIFTFSTDSIFNFEKIKQLQTTATAFPEHSVFVERYKDKSNSIPTISFIPTTTIIPPSFVTAQTVAKDIFTFSTDSTFNFEKFEQLQTTARILPEHSAFVEKYKEPMLATTNNPNEYIMPFNRNFNIQNASSQKMSRNDEISLNPSKQEVSGIVDAINKAVTDPCLQSLPNGFQLQYCSPTDSFLCPHGTFCQIGVGPQQTFCCPVIADNPCRQMRESGIGLTGLGRWYYDASDNHCKTFIFNGYKGNQNNFLTFRACQQSCGAINPCENGEPQMQTNAQEQCSPQNVYSCPQGYYCRILDDLTKTICCPGTTDQIMFPNSRTMISNPIAHVNSGSGNNYNLRGDNIDYIKSRTIDNANMAISNIAPVGSIDYINARPITTNEYLNSMTNGIQPNFANVSQPNIFIGRIGGSLETSNFIKTNAFGNSASVFSGNSPINPGVPVDSITGDAFGNLGISSRFNAGVQNLVPNTVIGNIQKNRCFLPLISGTGAYSLSRYYFDSEASLCRPFIYSGFNGNGNNFETIQECRITCPEYDNPCPVGLPYVDENDGSVAFCSPANLLCPMNYWCHIGDRRQTSVCCPSLLDPNTVPITNYSLRPARNSLPMNIMQSFIGPVSDMGIDDTEHYDMPATIPLACFQPLLEGKGQAKLTRYYFNSRTRTCNEFTYSGKGGNQNNFLSKIDCEETCPILKNPCENGLPAMSSEGNPILCGSDTTTICGIGYYCHIGATSSTTVCCPSIGDPCRMPVSRGNGNAVLNRWYYNTQSQICVNFVYSGQGGNSNNFRTREDCIEACPEFRNPCSTGRPHIGLNGQITHCGATGPLICPTTYWCHIGASLANSVCCPGTGIPCEQMLEIGNGNAILERFYYDSISRTCQQFQYSGLGGNENNFLTLRDCQERCPVLPNPCGLGHPQMDDDQNPVMCSASDTSMCNMGYFCHIGDTEETTVCCPGKSDNICNEPRVPGTGQAHLNRYAFAPLTKQCLPFIYTGLGVISNPCGNGEPAAGNDGQYLICSATGPNICPVGYWCHVGADIAASLCCPGAQNACILPLTEGTGNIAIPRWYFDRRLRQCSTFTYTGYGGNQNNFQTLRECQEKCPELANPCSMGDPAESLDGNILQCSALHPICPTSYFCNIGATPETSVCCPSFGEPCLSPLAIGTGTASLNRWYFDQNSRQCLQFTYTGIGGNENNFLTANACMQKCPILQNPCPFDGTTTNTNNLLTLPKCNVQNAYSCPPTYWCHIGGDADTTVCCPRASDPCQLSLSQGIITDNGPYTRWFYDRISGSCKPFQYAGIGEGKPVMVVPPILSPSPSSSLSSNMPSICPIGIPYQDENGLIPHCSFTNQCPMNYFCHFGADISTTVCCKVTTFMSPCSIPVQTGHGIGHMKRIYYNAALRQCIPFIYSGIGGNENNF